MLVVELVVVVRMFLETNFKKFKHLENNKLVVELVCGLELRMLKESFSPFF